MHINNHLIPLLLDQKLKIQQLQIRFSNLKQLRKLFQKCYSLLYFNPVQLLSILVQQRIHNLQLPRLFNLWTIPIPILHHSHEQLHNQKHKHIKLIFQKLLRNSNLNKLGLACLIHSNLSPCGICFVQFYFW